MSAAAASAPAPEWDDLQIIQALGGVEKGRWWNIASSALGTCSLAGHIGCSQDQAEAATAAAAAAAAAAVAAVAAAVAA